MRYNRILPILVSFLILLIFEIFYFYPKMIYVSLVIANLLVFFLLSQFAKASNVSKKWWNFLILPVFFLTSLAVYSAVSSNKYFVQSLFFLNSVFLYLYFRIIYYYLLDPAEHKKPMIENIFSYGNFLIFFFVSSGVYGLQSLLNVSVWPLMIIVVTVSILIVYQLMIIDNINSKSAAIYIFVDSLLLVEFAWAISFLPLNFNVSGLILAICYYMLVGLTRQHLIGKLDKKTIKLYLFFGFGSIVVALLTSKWM